MDQSGAAPFIVAIFLGVQTRLPWGQSWVLFRSMPDPYFPIATQPLTPDGVASTSVWGFSDSWFELQADRSVLMQGQRYALSQQRMDLLVPWIENLMGIRLSVHDRIASHYPPLVPSSRLQAGQLAALTALLGADAISTEDATRLRRGHGHTQEEMYALHFGDGLTRVPDVVVYPESEAQVQALVELAMTNHMVLVPFGGGTNVTEALRCPADEARTIVSVDMQRMHRVLWIDTQNRTACIEAGAVGRHLARVLAEQGWTMGHEPDSLEFSTLGGWIATHASGMKKNKYGNIEDIVLDVHVATAQGLLQRDRVVPRESTGYDLRHLVFGSEGNLGIVTQAVVRLHPLPAEQRYDSYIFPTFDQGVAFMRAVSDSGQVPASLRLMDNAQFQFGQVLKPSARSGLRKLKSRLEKWWVLQVKGLKVDEMVACTVVHEGGVAEVNAEQAHLKRLAQAHQGLRTGAENGERGYQMTFSIAYIRDFVMQHHMIAESFETTVAWSQALTLCAQVKARVFREHMERGLQGRPFVSCRVTQVYPSGVCIYFYLAIHVPGVVHPEKVYAELEHAAREEIIAQGGSLSHHHGIGKLRQRYLPKWLTPAELQLKHAIKAGYDPHNIFGINNQAVVPGSSHAAH